MTVFSLLFAVWTAFLDGIEPRFKLVFKTLTSALFIAGGAVFFAAHGSGDGAGMILAALVLGGAGDVLLSLHSLVGRNKAGAIDTDTAQKELRQKKRITLIFNALGGLCFVAGHALYIAVFVGRGEFQPSSPLGMPFFLIPALILALKIQKKTGNHKIGFAIVVYALVLGVFVLSAFNLVLWEATAQNVLIFVSALLFAASDFLLAVFNFTDGKTSKRIIFYFIMVCYALAQWGFVYSIAV